ncbi:MAG: polysaccharide deacetylase family protein [archaeon]
MLREIRDFIRFEASHGARVLFADLISVNLSWGQDDAISAILDCARRNRMRFTFFVSAKTVAKRISVVRQMMKGGHEIASHGYSHVLYERLEPAAIRSEFEIAAAEFSRHGITVRGFRPPFLSCREEVIKMLPDYGFSYISSEIGGKSRLYANRVMQVPVVKPYDWQGMRVEGKSMDELIRAWGQIDGSCLLFHPWIMKKYVEAIPRILEKGRDYRISGNLNGPAASFDVY